MTIRKVLSGLMVVLALGVLLIQFVPYGRAHANPPVTGEPNWDSLQTRELAQTACFDCHSNETVWPWYSHVAPVSWLVQRDVVEGREKLNFSEWGYGGEGDEGEDLYEVVANGEMPMSVYLITHMEARLSDGERTALADGLAATAGYSSTIGSQSHDEDRKD